jgi:hypothetical protein
MKGGIGLKNGLGLEEGRGGGGGKMWPTALVDNFASREYFFLIGIPRLGPMEMGSVRLRLRDRVKEFEGRVVSGKLVSECGFEVL